MWIYLKSLALVTGNILLSSMSNVYLFVFYYFHPSILDYFHPIHLGLWSKSMKGTSRLAQVILESDLCGFAWACWLAPHPPSAAGSSSRNRESHTRAPASAYWSCVHRPLPSSAAVLALTPTASSANSPSHPLGLFLHLSQIPVAVYSPIFIFFFLIQKIWSLSHLFNIKYKWSPLSQLLNCFLALPFPCYFIFCNIPLIYLYFARTAPKNLCYEVLIKCLEVTTNLHDPLLATNSESPFCPFLPQHSFSWPSPHAQEYFAGHCCAFPREGYWAREQTPGYASSLLWLLWN